MKVLITGQSGTGKTTVLQELARRGYNTYNTDDMPGLTRLESREDGQSVEWPTGLIDWTKYAWNWQDSSLRALLDTEQTIFVGAVTSNQQLYYPLFDHVIALKVSDEELYTRRLTRDLQRPNDDEQNVRQSVAKNQQKIAEFQRDGAIIIDNGQPVAQVVDHLLAVLHL